jgi:hypothetical protein
MLKPFPQSFWIKESLLCAGHYPGDIDSAVHLTKLNSLLDCGIRRVINLMEENEVNYGGRPFRPYDSTLVKLAAIRGMPAPVCFRIPLRDAKAPSITQMESLLCLVNEGIKNQIPTYVHCWGGHGRTGTFACCYLMQEGLSANEALTQLLQWRQRLPRNHFPLEDEQWQFVEQAHAWLSR